MKTFKLDIMNDDKNSNFILFLLKEGIERHKKVIRKNSEKKGKGMHDEKSEVIAHSIARSIHGDRLHIRFRTN